MTLSLLIAEDDPTIAKAVAYGARMSWQDARVTIVADGAAALAHFAAEQPDLVVLDVMMPPPDGLEVCRRIREISMVPILVLTARDSTIDKIRALDLGADDYLTKPFDPLELLARLRALLRRARSAEITAHGQLVVGDVVLDPARREVRVGGKVAPLTSTEFRLLEELMRRAGQVLTHHYLLTQVWGPEYGAENHYLQVFIARLRKKLDDDPGHPRYIQTEWHAGYRFALPL